MPASDAASARPLSPDERRQWDVDGYLLLADIVERSRIDALRDVFAEVADRLLLQLKAEGLIDDLHPDAPFETRFSDAAGEHAKRLGRSWRGQITSKALYDLHRAPRLVSALSQLMGGEVLGHPVWNARPKLPSQQLTVVPWHQDSSYFGDGSDKSRILTVWIPLVDTDFQNGCLQVIPGSHRLGLLRHEQETREGAFLEIKDVVASEKAVTCEMKIGDVLIFDNLMAHQSVANVSPGIRWSVDLRYYRGGDWIGAIDWPEPGFDWVIHSETREPTGFDEWLEHAKGVR